MAIALTSTTLVDSKKLAVVQFSAMYPGVETEEVDIVKIDASALSGEYTSTNLKILRVWYSCTIGGTFLEFDGSAQGLALPIPVDSAGYLDYRSMGGLRNTATTPTGDISLTTLGTGAAGTGYSITLELSKN